MKEFLDFDNNYGKHIRLFYYVFSGMGIFGNFIDIVIFDSQKIYLLSIYNAIVIAIILSGIILYKTQKINIKSAYIITLYSILANIILSNYTTLRIDSASYIYLLRESLYACFLISAAYLFLNEIHGLVTGLLFVIYFIIAAFVSKNPFLLNNLTGIVILYFAYILMLNYFYRYLNHTISKVSVDNQIINEQNEELVTINNELTETQRQINAQHEELITLSESIANQNKLLEEQNLRLEDSMQQKSRIFSIIAHDIKSPLSSIGSLTGIMLEKFDEMTEDKKKNYLTKMLTSNKLLQNLLDNLLTWTSTQSWLIEMKSEKIELRETIDKITDLYKNYASNKSLQLVWEVEENLHVIADRMMLETILRNLISNAIKYSFEHGIIRINAEKQGLYIKVAIQDRGIGINSERINTLFSYSDGIVTLGTQGEKGTGLGLRICKEFIEKLNGKIWIESEENLGTTINFILPFTMD